MPLASTSVQAAEVNSLFLWVLLICGGIFLIVWIGVFYCCRRFSAKNFDPQDLTEPEQIHGSRTLEWIWTIIPILILTLLGFLTIRGMYRILPAKGDRSPDLIVTGHQWWWSIEYPEYGVVTANEFLIPEGQRTLIALESADVIHSFWPTGLSPKQDMIPGHSRHLWIEALETGTYTGVCAEFCGTQHANMRFEVRVVPEPEFRAWITAQQRQAAPQTAGAGRGAELFQSLACGDCHAIQGTPASGTAGPDLTHLASRSWLAAQTIPNSRENLTRWLRDPDSLKPGSHMPDFKLSPTDLEALVNYLETLD